MKYLSLFSGIGGFEYGIQGAYVSFTEGLQQNNKNKNQNITTIKQPFVGKKPFCIGYSEIDKYAIQTYRRHFPDHKNWGDTRGIIPEELPDFDLLVGGFPCQSFSIAGKRGGFKDTRGTLFFEIARIARVKRPRYLLLENVKGLLSHDEGNTFATIISTLDELGYDCQWNVLNSKNFGVPQNRERVFIIGHIRGTSRPKVFPIGETTQGTIKVRARGKHQQDIVYDTKGILNLPAGTHGSTPHLTKIYDGYNKNYREDFGAIRTNAGCHTACNLIDSGMKIRRLTPTECERLQGFPDGWTEKGIDKNGKEVAISDSQRYKCLGNAVTTNVIEAIVKKFIRSLF